MGLPLPQSWTRTTPAWRPWAVSPAGPTWRRASSAARRRVTWAARFPPFFASATTGGSAKSARRTTSFASAAELAGITIVTYRQHPSWHTQRSAKQIYTRLATGSSLAVTLSCRARYRGKRACRTPQLCRPLCLLVNELRTCSGVWRLFARDAGARIGLHTGNVDRLRRPRKLCWVSSMRLGRWRLSGVRLLEQRLWRSR